MKKNLFRNIAIIVAPLILLTSCVQRPNYGDNNNETPDTSHKVTGKKIVKQWVLPYDWNYSYNTNHISSSNVITSKDQINFEKNSILKYIYSQQFINGMSRPDPEEEYTSPIKVDPFLEYNDSYFEDHFLIIGATYQTKGATLYSSGIGDEPVKYYSYINNKYEITDIFTPFNLDLVYETKPANEKEKELIFFIYDEFKISESAYKDKSKDEIYDLFFAGDTSDTELELYYYKVYKDEYNKENPDNPL